MKKEKPQWIHLNVRNHLSGETTACGKTARRIRSVDNFAFVTCPACRTADKKAGRSRSTKCDYLYKYVNNVLLILDQNLGRMSVINDIEAVLGELESIHGFDINNSFIIARDSEGEFDRILVAESKFVDFGIIDVGELFFRLFHL